MPPPLAQLLEPYGANPDKVIDLRGEATPNSLSYLDLVQARDRSIVPDGVVEGRGEPVAYVVDQESHPTGASLPHLRKTLTLRGDAPYLVVLEPGKLTVYDTSWREEPSLSSLDTVSRDDDRARTAFQRLNLALVQEGRSRHFLHELLFRLLNDAIDGLIRSRVERNDAISLAGRALFMRFLIDRGIVTTENLGEICPTADRLEQMFSGNERATSTCTWLQKTFNGDFLPLSYFKEPGSLDRVPKAAFDSLADVMHRSPGGQLLLNWGDLDFSHIPVGLLSQVYERQAEAWDPKGKRLESIYYTPFRIAEFMVKEVFAGLRETGAVPPHEARVLDPAAGGGVFLVSAFQEIVAAWWQHNGRSPNTREIRSILYRQLAGFEISEPALRLAALSLYLKAIELDLNPRPPEKLQFRPLRGTVLHGVREEGNDGSISEGSLGRHLPPEHRNAYDVVIGNPPWTTLGRGAKKLHQQIVQNLQPLIAERLRKEQAAEFKIPDQLPDLPFVWRAMEWAKPGGSIAFALHGRLLFKGSQGGQQARRDLFEALAVSGIMNGTDLRMTNVWPRVSSPFCLLFALNRRPEPDHAFYLTSPYFEENLNRQGRLRIDSKSAYLIGMRRMSDIPDLLKALFRGTALDVAILEKLRSQVATLGSYVSVARAGEGYKLSPPQEDAGFLIGLPNLTASYEGPVQIDPRKLPLFNRQRVHRRRKRTIFEGPLAVVRKSPPSNRRRGRAFCCLSDLAYSESFYGYSMRGHQEPETLARYLVLLFHSDLFLWHSLMVSGQFGVERDALYKDDVDSFPIRPLEKLASESRAEIHSLSELLLAGGSDVWPDLNSWAARVYGLNRWDQEAVSDTLNTSLPYHAVRQESQRPPKGSEVAAFVARLEHELEPVARAAGHAFSVRRLDPPTEAPWEVLCIDSRTSGAAHEQDPEPSILSGLFDQADQEGASQIFLIQPRRRLLLGILRQNRYWTQSRARLCALEILEAYLGTLVGES